MLSSSNEGKVNLTFDGKKKTVISLRDLLIRKF